MHTNTLIIVIYIPQQSQYKMHLPGFLQLGTLPLLHVAGHGIYKNKTCKYFYIHCSHVLTYFTGKISLFKHSVIMYTIIIMSLYNNSN